MRPRGEWADADKGPEEPYDWVKVEDYMGLFEHCEIMLQNKLIDLDTFAEIFGYRVQNILNNSKIVEEKLVKERYYWTLFIKLVDRLKKTDKI